MQWHAWKKYLVTFSVGKGKGKQKKVGLLNHYCEVQGTETVLFTFTLSPVE